MTRLDTTFLIQEPYEVYRAKSAEHLGSHRLSEFRKNPLLFHKKEQGMVPEEDRTAYLLGRAAHTLILEGRDVFETTYAVGGPVNPKTGERFGSRTKAFQDWADMQAKSVLTDEQAMLVERLHGSVRDHKHARELLSQGVAEGVVRVEYVGTPCQARLDWLNPERGIVDLKTCDKLDWFEVEGRGFGYIHQMAFYRALCALVLGETVPVWFIVVEKQEPFRCGVWRVSEDVLAAAQKENEAALRRLLNFRETDVWPTGYEEVRVLDYL